MNPILPITLTTNQADLKTRWLFEISQYVSDPLALHEHSVDDLRIDPTQIKSDTEGEEFRLPQRKASYESDGIKPSEVAKDHYLTATERELYAKQHAEEQQILLEQQKSFVQRKTQIATVQQQQQTQKPQISSSSITQTTKIVQESEQVVIQNKGVDKHAKLTRSTAIEKSEEFQTHGQPTKKDKEVVNITEVKTNQSTTSNRTAEKISEIISEKSITSRVEQQQKEQSHVKIDQIPTKENPKEINVTGKSGYDLKEVVEKTKTLQTAANESIKKIEILNAKISDAQITLATAATNKSVPVHTVENQLALENHAKKTPKSPQDGGGDNHNTQKPNDKENTSPNSNKTNQSSNQLPAQRLHTVSKFNFGDKPGPSGTPPTPNLPNFLVPPHLITYETSIEINVQKIPPPQPPQPPKFIKKLLVHTESLERKTRAFLSGNYEAGTTDSSIRTARQKIRSLKSTIIKSDDEVKHAEDTITKAQSGDFLHIFNPPIIEKPLYEFVEIPSERSEEECSEYSDRRSERGISEQHENMEDYYSSKYSSRSSRRRVEGKSN